MRRFAYVISLVMIVFAVCNLSAQQPNTSAVPNLINYSGTLLQAGSLPIPPRTVGMTFAIYKQQEGGAPVWMETQNVTLDASGHYSVMLGSTRAEGLPTDLFSAQEERWLEVKAEGKPEQPRVMLVSVPYAMKAAEADRLAGHSASEFVTTENLQSVVQQQLQEQAGGSLQGRVSTLAVSSNGSASPYINNGTVLQVGGNFNIDGDGTAAILNATGNYNLAGAPVLGNSGTQGMFLGTGAGSSNAGSFNLFVGTAAGHNTTMADFNTFIGTNAGYFNTTGTQNFMLGATTGYHNTTGSYNMFVGSLAGYNNTTGTRNAFVGRAAGIANITGTGNSFFGANAGSSSTADFNTFLGGFSGTATTTGNHNTFVGWQAGPVNVTGSNNLILGYNAGSAAGTSSNNDIYIASPGAGMDNGVIRIGTPANQTSAYMAGIYGNAPSGALPVVVNSSGQLGTTTAGIGVTSFNGRAGAVVPASNDYGFSLLSGTLGSSQLSGIYGSAVTLSNTANVYYGNGANLTGVVAGSGSPFYIQNGASVQPSANFNISGTGTATSFNSATGYQIGGSSVMSIGSAFDSNLFLGVGAGAKDVTGLGVDNVFLGYNAGSNNTDGVLNTFDGTLSGNRNTTGYYNTFSGASAGTNNTTGNNNTFVGAFAGYSNILGNNDVYIASSGSLSGTESNAIRIGSPIVQTSAYIAGIYGSTSSGGVAVYINNAGQLGTLTSSRRFKEQIRDMGDSTSALMKLRPVTFLYKPEYDKGPRTLQYGLIAEEVAEVYPELVAYQEDGKPYTVKYQYLASMLLNEVQKQEHRADAEAEVIKTQADTMEIQQQEIDGLKAQLRLQNAAMVERLSRLESMVERQTQTAVSLPQK